MYSNGNTKHNVSEHALFTMQLSLQRRAQLIAIYLMLHYDLLSTFNTATYLLKITTSSKLKFKGK